MQNVTIRWTCTSAPKWEWLSMGPGNPGIPISPGSLQRTGTVSLPPNEDYWYPCIALVLQGVTTGNAGLQCSVDANGKPQVKVMTVAQGKWISYGQPGQQSQTDGTGANGGISLFAEVVS